MNPTCRQESIPDDPAVEYVLDYSSLMLFYELSGTEGLTFRHQFVVSKVVEEIAERQIEKLEKSPDESLSVNISLDGVEPIMQTKERLTLSVNRKVEQVKVPWDKLVR